MKEDVRVEEYSVASAEQRRSMADSIAEEFEQGATVVGIFPVALQAVGEDLTTTRVAVLFLGRSQPDSGLAATAAAIAEEPETPSATIVEEIMQIPPHEPENPDI